MPDQKLTELDAVVTLATGDLLYIVDVSEPDEADQSKKLPLSLLDSRYQGVSITVDTQAAILATSPDNPTIAFATDTGEFLLWDGSTWWGVTMTALTLTFGQLDFSDENNSAWIGVI